MVPMASPVEEMTSRRKMNRAAFTLLETLLVIALIGLITTTVIPNIQSVFRVSVQASVRRFSSLIRYTYDQAILTGKVHRIVLDLKQQKWSLEIGGSSTLPADQLKSQITGSDEPKAPVAQFDKVNNKDTQRIPKGVVISRASSWRLGKDKYIEDGQLAIYAFPSGLMDEATIVLKEATSTQSFKVTTRPLTGRVDVEVLNEP